MSWSRFGLARFEQLQIRGGLVRDAPVDEGKLRERPARFGCIEPQWDETEILIQRIAEAEGLAFERGPV